MSELSELGPADINHRCGDDVKSCIFLSLYLDYYYEVTTTITIRIASKSSRMSETMFAKAIMAGLDKRPSRLASDHVSDPRKYPAQTPVTTHLCATIT